MVTVAELQAQYNTVLAERDALQGQLNTVTAERDTLQAEMDKLNGLIQADPTTQGQLDQKIVTLQEKRTQQVNRQTALGNLPLLEHELSALRVESNKIIQSIDNEIAEITLLKGGTA